MISRQPQRSAASALLSQTKLVAGKFLFQSRLLFLWAVGCLESQWSGQWSVLSSVLSGIACLSDDFPSDLRTVEIVKTSQTKAVRGVTSRHGNFSSEFPVFPLLRVSRKPGATFKISTVEQQQQQQRGNKLRGRAEK